MSERETKEKTISVRLPGTATQKVEDWTMLLDISVSEFIRQAIDTQIEHLRATCDIDAMVNERRIKMEETLGSLAQTTPAD